MGKPNTLARLALAGASLALAGCGGDAPSDAGPKGPVQRHIFVSAVDCEASGKYPIEECSAAIERAVRMHEKQAPNHLSLTTCETAEGVDKCERVGDRAFRPFLAAFVFDAAKPPQAKPLYLTIDNSPGFRTADKEKMSPTDDYLVFSKSATDLYEIRSARKK